MSININGDFSLLQSLMEVYFCALCISLSKRKNYWKKEIFQMKLHEKNIEMAT